MFTEQKGEVGKMRCTEAKVGVGPSEFAANFPVNRQIEAVTGADGEGWRVVDVGSRRADDGVNMTMSPVRCNNAVCGEPSRHISIRGCL